MKLPKSTLIALALATILFIFLLTPRAQQEKSETNITPLFNVGEQMIYEVKMINASGEYYTCTLNLSVIGTAIINQSKCFILRAEFSKYSDEFLASINSTHHYLLMYSYVTMDNITLLKTYAESPFGNVTVIYDNHRRKCFIDEKTPDGEVNTYELDIKPGIQDPLSTLYYVRSLPLQEEYWCTFNQLTSVGPLLVKASVSKNLHIIDTDLGPIECYEITLEAGRAKTILYIATSISSRRVLTAVKIPIDSGVYEYWRLVSYMPPTTTD